MASRHDPEWLVEVRQPGPNGRTFWKSGEVVSGERQGLWSRLTRAGLVPAYASGNLIEDDVTASLFTPGCAGYAGYSAGSFSNMAAVRAYAAKQNARAFAYSGIASQLSGADAIDMEPGLAPTSAASAAYKLGIRYFYTSASSVSSVNSYLSGAGISRSSYKIISAHYSGEHICGPSTCGYPQADATQFTDAYLGKSLDCTVFDASFFGAAPSTNPWPLSVGSTGANVVTAQKNLNKWGYASPALTTDGNFGALTQTAVEKAQTAHKLPVNGTVDETLWKILLGSPATPPPPPQQPFYGRPGNLAAVAATPPTMDYVLTWSVPAPVAGVPAPTEYQVYVYDGVADVAHLFQKEATVTTTKLGVNGLKRGHTYIVHVVAAGVAKYVGADVFATLTIKP
jgi:peptidoglycan hydrolase-like protein with peptidoglycan-binding domain